MPRTFGEHFDKVCVSEYALKPTDMRQYLSGEYFGTGKPNDLGRFSLEIIWDRQEFGAIAGLVRNSILPESLNLYAKDNEVDIALGEAIVMGHIAITSADLTDRAMLGIVETRMPLRPFVPKPRATLK